MRKALEFYKPHFKIIIYIVVFVVCFGLALMIMSSGSQNRLQLPFKNSNVTPSAVQQPLSNARMDLTTIDGSQNYPVGKDIELQVSADSDNLSVTGYDLLFLYDPANIAIVKVTSLDPTFDAFTFNNSGYISVTGTKKLSVSSVMPFANSKILSIVIRAKKQGNTPVMIAPQLGREKTKLVDDKANIVIPRLSQTIQLNIQ